MGGEESLEYKRQAERVLKLESDELVSMVNRAGLSISDLNTKIIKNKDIDQSDYDKLTEAGLPLEEITTHVKEARRTIEHNTNDAIDSCGGEQKMSRLLDWASANLSDTVKNGFNSLLQSSEYKTALELLQEHYNNDTLRKQEGTLMEANTMNTQNDTTGYASRMEMINDMRNPEYNRSPTFRAKVAQRIKNADWRQSQGTQMQNPEWSDV